MAGTSARSRTPSPLKSPASTVRDVIVIARFCVAPTTALLALAKMLYFVVFPRSPLVLCGSAQLVLSNITWPTPEAYELYSVELGAWLP